MPPTGFPLAVLGLLLSQRGLEVQKQLPLFRSEPAAADVADMTARQGQFAVRRGRQDHSAARRRTGTAPQAPSLDHATGGSRRIAPPGGSTPGSRIARRRRGGSAGDKPWPASSGLPSRSAGDVKDVQGRRAATVAGRPTTCSRARPRAPTRRRREPRRVAESVEGIGSAVSVAMKSRRGAINARDLEQLDEKKACRVRADGFGCFVRSSKPESENSC